MSSPGSPSRPSSRRWPVAGDPSRSEPSRQPPRRERSRIAASEQGRQGKSFAGATPASLVDANKALEAEFAADGTQIEWKFFKGAGPAINEGIAAGALALVILGDLAGVIGRASGLKTRLVLANSRGDKRYLATALSSDIKCFKDPGAVAGLVRKYWQLEPAEGAMIVNDAVTFLRGWSWPTEADATAVWKSRSPGGHQGDRAAPDLAPGGRPGVADRAAGRPQLKPRRPARSGISNPVLRRCLEGSRLRESPVHPSTSRHS